jgi:hypothetical protein
VSACDPLAPQALPITLEKILGVGKDESGTLYVADQTTDGSYTNRVFVSSGSTLYRKRVNGSGSSANDYSFSYAADPLSDGGAHYEALLVHEEDGHATAMALGPPDQKGFIGEPGAASETLTVVDASALQGFTVKNLPGDVAIVLFADDPSGETFLLTRPVDDATDSSYRLFYGPKDAVAERHITNISESLSDSFYIQFSVGPASYAVSSSIVYGGDAGILGRPGGVTVQSDSSTESFPVTWPPPKTLSGASFQCFE